jgi:hypothetical protein
MNPPNPGITESVFELDFDPILVPLAGLGLGILWLITTQRLDSRWGTWRFAARLITGFPPLFTVLVSPVITYFYLCGSLSAITASLIHSGGSGEPVPKEFFLGMMKAVEWFCSFISPLVLSDYLVRIRLSFSHCFVLALSHALVAGYRTAKYTYTEIGLSQHFVSGPKVLEQFEMIDGLVPIAAFAAFVFWHNRKNARKQGTQADLTIA